MSGTAGRRQRGSASVEFALILPILVVVGLAMVQVGILVRDQLVLVAAARAGARAAAVDDREAEVRAAVEAAATTIDGRAISMHVTREGGRGEPVTVSLVYTARFTVPFVNWLFPHTVGIRADATMRQEFG